MPHWSIIVEFETQDGREDDVAALLGDHARRTLSEEDGCLGFEVLRPIERDGRPVPGKVIVSETYAGEAAVSAHEAGPRMQPLGAALAPLVKSRRKIFSLVAGSGQPEAGLTPEQLNASNDG
ncbi:MAG: putative quinol monooxygenase [Rhizobiaceae bacterium]